MALQRLKEAAEKSKIELSQVAETEINLPSSPPRRGPAAPAQDPHPLEFQKMTEDLVEATTAPSTGRQGRG